MAPVSIKCNVCGLDLKGEQYCIWDVGGRKLIEFRCPTKKHFYDAEYEIIVPEMEIYAYTFLMEKMTIRVTQTATTLSTFPLSRPYHDNVVLTVPRFYPLIIQENMLPQLTNVYKKLKNLIIFT